MKRAVPRPVAADRPPPHELGGGLWALDRQLQHFGMARLPTRTTLVRLRNGSLVVVSPPALVDADAAAAIGAIGPVRQVVIPNSFHYLYAPEFRRHCPDATLLAPPGLAGRVPELPVDAELGPDPPPGWAGELEYTVLGPVGGASEVLFFHVPSATLLLTDVAFHMVHYPRPLDRLVWRLSGIPTHFGPGRTSRMMLLRDREVAHRALVRARAWPFERIVVSHGEPVEGDARAAFERAFAAYLGGSDP